MRWENVECYDASTNQIYSHFELQPMIIDDFFIDEKTTKIVKAFHLLSVYDDYDTEIARIKITPVESAVRLTITPLEGIEFFFRFIDDNYEIKIDKERTIRFNPYSGKMLIIGVKPFNMSQRVLVI